MGAIMTSTIDKSILTMTRFDRAIDHAILCLSMEGMTLSFHQPTRSNPVATCGAPWRSYELITKLQFIHPKANTFQHDQMITVLAGVVVNDGHHAC